MGAKKAQFYIIITAIIVVVMTGLITIVNYVVVKPEPVQFYDLSKQLERETAKVIDYGVYHEKDITQYLDDFIKNSFLKYAHEKDPELGLIYIYGNSTVLVVANYGKDDAGIITETNKTVLYGSEAEAVSQIRVDIAGQQVGKKIVEERSIFGNIKASIPLSQPKEVKINMSDKIYNFELRGQQYFFAIVKSEKEGETYYQIIND